MVAISDMGKTPLGHGESLPALVRLSYESQQTGRSRHKQGYGARAQAILDGWRRQNFFDGGAGA